MNTINRFAVIACAIACLCFALVSGPRSPASANESVSSATPRLVASEPVIELHPDADVTDPELQQAVQELRHEVLEDMAQTAASTAEPTEEDLRPQAGPAGFSVTFNTSGVGTLPTSTQQASIQRAVSSWASALETSTGPVVVEFTWRNNFSSSGILGFASSQLWFDTTNGELVPTALWNTQNNTDINGGAPEIEVHLNSSFNWYSGTGNPPNGQIDLESVVLHEVAHGLGFSGTASPTTTPSLPSVYEKEITFGGIPFLDTPNPTSTLTSNNLNVDVSDSHQFSVHAPSTWIPGSSLSHFDETSHPSGTPGALMTPTILAGDTHRSTDAPVLGVMNQIGWDLNVPIAAPSNVSVDASGNPVTVTWNTNFDTVSYVPDFYRVDVLAGSTVIDSQNIPASTNVATFNGLTPGTRTFRVTPVDQVGLLANTDGTSASRSAVISDGTATTPSEVNYVSISGSGLTQTIDWPNAGGDPTNYLVEISTNGQTWTQIGSPSTSSMNYTFSEGTYQIRVRGQNSLGFGPANTSTFVPIGAGFVRPAPLDHQIRRLYLSTFLREPDQTGFEDWRFERAGLRSLASIADHFAGSAEFQARYGNLNNTQFVEQLYLNVFGRPLDPVGRATWVGLLDSGGSRGEVLSRLSESNEFVANTDTLKQSSNEGAVRRLYLGYFKRLPDSAGLAFWVGELDRGRSIESVSEHFAGSDEFIATYGSLSNEEFVELLYFNILSRNPDNQGRQEWTTRLNFGTRTRGSVMVGFSNSRELVLLTGTAR